MYDSCTLPCRTIFIKNFHLKLENLIFETFYLHVELPLFDELNGIPVNKYVSVEFNIKLVCKEEKMKYPPKPIDLVYQRISNDSIKISQSFQSTTNIFNKILLPL